MKAALLLVALICLHVINGAEGDSTLILHESGQFSGTGYHEISASGPLCSLTIHPGNESILTASNDSTWILQQNGSLTEVV